MAKDKIVELNSNVDLKIKNLEVGGELVSGKAPGVMASPESAKELMLNIQASISPKILNKMSKMIMGNITENNLDGVDDDQYDVDYTIEEVQQNLPTIISNAIIGTGLEDRNSSSNLPVVPEWNRLVDFAQGPAHVSHLNDIVPKTLGIFPCFKELSNTLGNATAVSQLETMHTLKIEYPERVPGNMRQQMAEMQRSSNVDRQMDAMAGWISENGAVVEKSIIRFPQMITGYASKVVFAVTEDRSYLLVKEESQLADYSYDHTTGEIAITVNAGKTINTGDVLEVISIESDQLSMVELMENVATSRYLDFVVVDDNKIEVVYTGKSLNAGQTINDIIEISDSALGLYLNSKLDFIGELNGVNGGSSPFDAKYIFSWDGGRRHYLDNPNHLLKLGSVFGDKKIGGVPSLTNTTSNKTIVKIEPEIKTVTKAEKFEHNIVKSSNPLAVMKKELGFSKGNYQGNPCFYKERNDGILIVVTSGDSKPITITKNFNVMELDNLEAEAIASECVGPDNIRDYLNNIFDNNQLKL